jgi:leucyl aminopeptidase
MLFSFTGTCISSLSNRYIGAFTNRKEHTGEIILAGEKSGERVWPFPLDDDFAEDLKSDIADILQVGPRSRI